MYFVRCRLLRIFIQTNLHKTALYVFWRQRSTYLKCASDCAVCIYFWVLCVLKTAQYVFEMCIRLRCMYFFFLCILKTAQYVFEMCIRLRCMYFSFFMYFKDSAVRIWNVHKTTLYFFYFFYVFWRQRSTCLKCAQDCAVCILHTQIRRSLHL